MSQSVTSAILPLKCAVSSLIGGRPENQDDLGWVDTPLGFLLVVCDGMGGGPGGKTASYLAKTAFMQTMYGCPSQADPREALRMAVARAEEALEQKMTEMPSLRGMGSTLVAILVSAASAYIVHLGDSRCYRLRGSKILFRTKDHSLVGELVQSKALTEEQARVSPQSNVITRGLGSTSNHVSEIDEVPYRKGDRFVLCTDGVWGIMPQTELLQRLGVMTDVANIVDNLQAEVDRRGASEGGGHHDNHTLAILEMNTDSILKDKMSKQFIILLASVGGLLLISLIFNGVGFAELRKSKKACEQAILKLAEKEQQLSAYEQHFNSSEKENILQYGALLKQNEELQKQNRELLAIIDSLKKEIQSPSPKPNPQNPATKQVTANHPQRDNDGVKVSEPVEPRKLAEKIINRFDDLGRIREKDISAAVKRIKEVRDDIARKLDELGKYTTNTRRTENIKNSLPKDDEIARSIGKDKKGECYPNEYLKRNFDKSLKKVKELKENIK
ncbi:MAG: serine/threonine-protein phosphatase [Prevotella sp.]|nr:serine/threonine-protein phosphatase [Prevotella sp.]